MAKKSGITLLRQLIHELRLSTHGQSSVKDSLMYQYIINGFRQNQVSDLQYCREKDELAFMAQTYNTYLNSSRRLKSIHEEYHSKGERTVEEAATMVGFKLPQDPR